MLVTFQTAIAGHIDARNDFVFYNGQTADVDDSDGQKWIDSGIALPVDPKPAIPAGFELAEIVSQPRRGKRTGK